MEIARASISRRSCLLAAGIAISGSELTKAVSAHAEEGQRIRARLSLNENPFGPSPLALRAIQAELPDVSRYTGPEADRLIRAIAAHEAVAAEHVILGEVLEELGLHLALNGPAGGEFIYSEPGYTALVDAVAPGGGVVAGVPIDGKLENDLPAIAARVTDKTRAIYLVNPHNPTGTVSDAATFLDFVGKLSKRVTVIVDEAYLEFDPDFAKRTVAPLTRAGENVIVFRTFAKAYGLAGLAMGYALAPRPIADLLRRAGVGYAHSLNRLALAAAKASLNDNGYIPATRAKVVAERIKWETFLDSRKIRRTISKGNFVFFETGRPHDEISQALLARGIEIARAFPPYDRWVRISIGLPEENSLARNAVADLLR